jgi:hypothetical protein
LRYRTLKLSTWLLPALIAFVAFAVPGVATAAGTGNIAGTVLAEGAATAGIEVCAEGVAGTVTATNFGCTEADAAFGEYEIENLPVGNYYVYFYPGALNYVAQFWQETNTFASASPVTVTEGTKPGIDAELVKGTTLSGTVTAAATGRPVARVEACASMVNALERCAETDGNGHYSIPGLFTGSWEVAFYPYETGQDLVYQRDPNPVSVTTGTPVTGVNAALVSGGQIGGTTRLAATGAPLAGVRVCLVDAVEVFTYGCLKTPASGGYRFTGLFANSYKVVFSPETSELVGPEAEPEEAANLAEAADAYPTQWWNAKTSFGLADPIAITPPAMVTGIDGSLGPPPAVAPPAPPATPAPVVAKPKKLPVLICHKGFAKRKVKGKLRCLKLHKKHHHRHHKKHPRHRAA